MDHGTVKKIDDFRIIQGDALAELPKFPADRFDSCVTDPPYELGFMGKAWDKSGIANNVDLWRAVFRVLKPGAYLLAFGGTRTYHRMACAIEDAGFEIRDQIQWIYGSGFPKSLDVSKAIDREAGAERGRSERAAFGGTFSDDNGTTYGTIIDAEPITVAAKYWNGWGTALKPANEPICLARKPLEKGLTVAQNVLKWGTGAINIDACRVPTEDVLTGSGTPPLSYCGANPRPFHANAVPLGMNQNPAGRFPSNVIHDGSDEVLAGFPASESVGHTPRARGVGGLSTNGHSGQSDVEEMHFNTGSAARFFYCAKASNYDREAGRRTLGNFPEDPGKEGSPSARNVHPTVKPTELMQYLCRLITQPNGLILDPFLGSGSTAKAAFIERFGCVGIELNEEYAEIARNRVKNLQVKLF